MAEAAPRTVLDLVLYLLDEESDFYAFSPTNCSVGIDSPGND
jgi:hypothetical protein